MFRLGVGSNSGARRTWGTGIAALLVTSLATLVFGVFPSSVLMFNDFPMMIMGIFLQASLTAPWAYFSGLLARNLKEGAGTSLAMIGTLALLVGIIPLLPYWISKAVSAPPSQAEPEWIGNLRLTLLVISIIGIIIIATAFLFFREERQISRQGGGTTVEAISRSKRRGAVVFVAGIIIAGIIGLIFASRGFLKMNNLKTRPVAIILEVKTVYFVEAHGEKSILSNDDDGYASIERTLKSKNYLVNTGDLASTNRVPSDCSALVIAGPVMPFLPQEVAIIRTYLDAGGRVLLLIDPDTDPQLSDILKNWNIQLGNDRVIDVSSVGSLFDVGPLAPVVMSYGGHAISNGLQRGVTFFPLARSVKASDPSKTDVSTIELLKTSESSWAETNIKGKSAKFDEGKDIRGPINLGVAASKKVGEKEARLVVIGDSDFATNKFTKNQHAQFNSELFLNVINWLARDTESKTP